MSGWPSDNDYSINITVNLSRHGTGEHIGLNQSFQFKEQLPSEIFAILGRFSQLAEDLKAEYSHSDPVITRQSPQGP